MATAWLKSIHCKSSVLDDIVYHPLPFDSTAPRKKPPKPPSPCTSQSSSSSASTSSSSKKVPLLPLGCGNSNRDVVPLFSRKPGTGGCHHHGQQRHSSKTAKQQQQQGKKTKGGAVKGASQHRLPLNSLKSPSPVFCAPSSFPTLTELARGHSSRQVVEIIFTSSWADQQPPQHFSGEIEMLFRVHNPSTAVSRFEACRAAVRSRAGASDARCAADGNEMMRFRPAAAVPMAATAAAALQHLGKAGTPSVVFSASVNAGTGGVVRTYAGSGEAHESGGGARGGRRAMLVCRVIAGRVRVDDDEDSCNGSETGEDYQYDSVAVGKGELLVFDPGAVLPCFLIIYKV